jgi:hypothetical protein
MSIYDTINEKHVGKFIIGLIGFSDGMFYPQKSFDTLEDAEKNLDAVRDNRRRVTFVIIKVENYSPTIVE